MLRAAPIPGIRISRINWEFIPGTVPVMLVVKSRTLMAEMKKARSDKDGKIYTEKAQMINNALLIVFFMLLIFTENEYQFSRIRRIADNGCFKF